MSASSSLVLAATLVACTNAPPAAPDGPANNPVDAAADAAQVVPACDNGTVASYLGTSCSQDATVFQWLSYSCTSYPTSICTALGANGANLNMRKDPAGPHTILAGGTALWNVTANERVDVVIRGTVYGATANLSWPHFQGLAGQTNDGTSENITTVDCATTGNCLDANQGVSDLRCDAAGPAANCTDQQTEGPYITYGAKFNPAPPESPYDLIVEVKLDGHATGTATLRSIGMHVGAPLM